MRRRWPGRRTSRRGPRARPSGPRGPRPPPGGRPVGPASRIGIVIGVLMGPGPTAFTRTPALAHSSARHLVSMASPALLTQQWALPGLGSVDVVEAILMTDPRPRASMARPTARHVFHGPLRLTASI